MTKLKLYILIFIFFCTGAVTFAQFRGGMRVSSRNNRDNQGNSYSSNGRGSYDNRAGIPDWEPDSEFVDDVFTFVRIQYSSGYGGFGRGSSGGSWDTDFPDSELNFSYRLHQLTSLQVSPNPITMRLTDPELYNYPFIYIVEPGRLVFAEREVDALRKYLYNGGFLLVDDFWGRDEWNNIYYEIKRVFPDREPVELTLDHPIFHCVFELKEMPQIPSINHAINTATDTLTGVTTERSDAPRAIYYAIYDDKGRIMVIICRDTDLGDGWEREGESLAYFREFSEKKAYPLGINIIFYMMTH